MKVWYLHARCCFPIIVILAIFCTYLADSSVNTSRDSPLSSSTKSLGFVRTNFDRFYAGINTADIWPDILHHTTYPFTCICEVIKRNELYVRNIGFKIYAIIIWFFFVSYWFQLDKLIYIFQTISLILMRLSKIKLFECFNKFTIW